MFNSVATYLMAVVSSFYPDDIRYGSHNYHCCNIIFNQLITCPIRLIYHTIHVRTWTLIDGAHVCILSAVQLIWSTEVTCQYSAHPLRTLLGELSFCCTTLYTCTFGCDIHIVGFKVLLSCHGSYIMYTCNTGDNYNCLYCS